MNILVVVVAVKAGNIAENITSRLVHGSVWLPIVVGTVAAGVAGGLTAGIATRIGNKWQKAHA